MRNILKKTAFPLLILIIGIIVFFTNYKPGTFLIGWDNLFPEFNFGLNIKREIFAIWQEYRGMGTIDGMSHASLIIHDIERWLMSFIFPTSLIRWVYVLAMHLLGGLGMYFLLYMFVLKQKAKGNITKLLALIGALLYQYNLGTIQQFFLPLELFTVHFAFLPWLVFLALRYIENNNKKNLLCFFFVSALSAPQAHVPTIFIVYTMAMGLVFLSILFTSRMTKIKEIFILILIIFITNVYWGLPFAYSTLTHAKVISSSKAFEMGTNDIFYRNNKFGDLSDVATMKGLVLDYNYLDYKTGNYRPMMQIWLYHLQQPYFYIPACIFFILAVIGLIKIVKDKDPANMPFAVLFVFSIFMMGTDTPLIGTLSGWLRNHIPLFQIIFRFVFTKFSILYVFSYYIMLSVGLLWIVNRVKKDFIRYVIIITVVILIFIYSLPSFTGHFFYENLAVKIPNEYLQLFDFFNHQDSNSRIANLPIPWYWAWLQPNWGTINSGFVWYAIPQPFTDLAFTYWHNTNENFYWELDQAIYSQDPNLLTKVLNKYDITWIYLDKNIYNNPGQKITYADYENLLNKTVGVKLVKQFNLIKIYHFDNISQLQNFKGIKNNVTSVGPDYNYDNYDVAYLNHGDYTTDKNSNYYYPFRNLFSNKNPIDEQYKIEENNNVISFTNTLPSSKLALQTPQIFPEEFQVFDKNLNLKTYQPQIITDNEGSFSVNFDKNILLKYTNNSDQQYLNQTNNACSKNANGQALIEKIKIDEKTNYKLTSIGSHNCIKIDLPDLSHRFGYLVDLTVTTDPKRGLSINFFNEAVKKSDLDIYTDNDGDIHNYHLIIPPSDFYGIGYTLYFDNISEGREKIINTIGGVNIYQIPYYYLKNLRLTRSDLSTSSIFYLSQSYNPAWKAYYVDNTGFFNTYFPFLSGQEIKDHVLVNNWANGWKLNQDQISNIKDQKQIVIIFWPQYLEFAGFGLLAAVFLFILFYQPKIKIDDKNI